MKKVHFNVNLTSINPQNYFILQKKFFFNSNSILNKTYVKRSSDYFTNIDQSTKLILLKEVLKLKLDFQNVPNISEQNVFQG